MITALLILCGVLAVTALTALVAAVWCFRIAAALYRAIETTLED